MKYLAYLFSAINLYVGARFLLNAIGILGTSKYANSSNIFFAITLTTASVAALYVSLAMQRHGLSLLIDLSPWIITLIILLFNMLTGDYK